MNNLTIRSKIMVRWTTNPADMGYGGIQSDWQRGAGKIMSVRKAVKFNIEHIVGQGVFNRVKFTHNGREVTREELMEVIFYSTRTTNRQSSRKN